MDGWIETQIDMKAVDWKGKPIQLKDVKALQHIKTGQVRVYPADVAKAEIRMLAEKQGLEPRDVATLLMLKARPGVFPSGQVLFKYHLNKMLFYQWMEMEKNKIGETFLHDDFEPKRYGPVPKHLWEDLKRLEERELVATELVPWDTGPKKRLNIELTKAGKVIASELWRKVPNPLREITKKVKEDLFPLNPKTIRKAVHRDYPEFRKSYVEEDIE